MKFKSVITGMAVAALFFSASAVYANDHESNTERAVAEYTENSIMAAPVIETVRYAILRNAEPKNGWCGFNDRLARNVKYPEFLKQMGVEGTINVQFIVNETGNIERVRTNAANKIEANEGHINILKEEAKRAVIASFGEWRPSTIDGEPVSSSTFVVPVTFKVDYLTVR